MASSTSVRIEPSELRFPVALGTATVQKLRVVAVGASTTFKIKTTNPKRYSVRPNVGIAWAGAAADVTVQLCAFKELPSDLAKCKDKFQVLSLVLTDEQSQQLEAMAQEERRAMLNELWAADEVKAAAVTKIRCSFLLPSTQPMPIPEEGESNPPTPVPTTPLAAAGGAEESPAAEAASPAAEASSSAAASGAGAASAAEAGAASAEAQQLAAANEQLRLALQKLDESEAARRTLTQQMKKAMLEHEDEVDALKQELSEQRLKQPPPAPLKGGAGDGGGKGATVGSSVGGFTTLQLVLVALLGLLLGAVGQLPFGGAAAPAAATTAAAPTPDPPAYRAATEGAAAEPAPAAEPE